MDSFASPFSTPLSRVLAPVGSRHRDGVRTRLLIGGFGPKMRRLMRRALLLGMLAAVLAVTAVAAINLWMTLSVRGDTRTVESVPHAQAAIVLGALVNPDGSMSVMLADRVARGAELYNAGKVDRVIVSGDHGQWEYDEPGVMRDALIAAGVPASAIFTDHAGFNTWASVRRAREVFNVRSATIVTQGFHMTRALYLAEAAGLHAYGVTADMHPWGRQGTRSTVREIPARVKAFRAAIFNTPVLLGPKVPVTGDGRASWGPKGP